MHLKSWIKQKWENRHLPNIFKTERYSQSEIKKFQEKHLKKIIHYSYHNIPYYKKLFEQRNIHPNDIRGIEDLKKIPPLSRKKAIENYDSLINPSFILNTHLSSATTGQRLKWAYSKEWGNLFNQILWRGFSWAGLNHDKRVVSFFSRVIGEVTKNSLIIREGFDKDLIDNHIDSVLKFKPDFAYCYASSAYLTAQYLLQKGLKIPLEGIIVTSDHLFPHFKPVIEEAFQCKVFNNYGCNDGGAWGAECVERTGFHHDFERSIIEFDENGKMLLTDLWNTAMPFIRYENGDTGEWIKQACKCGRQMSLFKVNGRLSDYIITPTQVFSPTAIDILLRNEYFINIQLVQQNEQKIDIFYTPHPQFEMKEIKDFLQRFIGHFKNVDVALNEQESPEKSNSLKRRICINKSAQTIENFFR